jgi:hypothetical protein
MTEWCSGLVVQPAFYSRNGVTYMVAAHWRADLKAEQIGHLKRAKSEGCCETCELAAETVAGLLSNVFGPLAGAVITSVPCGHSRVPDCLGKRLAQAVAARLAVPFVQVWEDRFVAGVSHPKEFAKLPPLEWIERPQSRVIVIDDVATSGWHLEEALTALRSAGLEAFGVAWIGGRRRADDEEEPAGPPSIFGGGRRWGRSFGAR